jgi:ANTAR domain/GAF domain
VELFQLQHDQGPCLECYQTGRPVYEADMAAAAERWPVFAPAAAGAGFAAMQAIPMRLRDDVIGAMNLFMHTPRRLDETGLRVGQALADVATIGLLQERNLRHQEVLAEQLQGALNSRIVIEQAKGVLAERLGLDMGQAFGQLRGQARLQNRRLAELAGAVANGSENVADWQAVRSSRSG